MVVRWLLVTLIVAWLGIGAFMLVTTSESEPALTAEEELDRACVAAGEPDPGSLRVREGVSAEERLAGFREASAKLARAKDNISKAGALDTAVLDENPQWFDAEDEARRQMGAMCHGRDST